MPSLPKWLSDRMETLYKQHYHPVEVTHVEYLDPALKLIRFEGEIDSTDFVAGHVIEFRVTDTEFRHYTPSVYDTERKVCEVIFYLHDKGVGSRWAKGLKVGDRMKLIGPGGKMGYSPQFKKHMLFGDETSLGLMNCMEQAVRRNGQEYLSLLELGKERLDWVAYLNPSPVKLAETSFENPAQPMIDLLSGQGEAFWDDVGEAYFYLTGRAKSIQALRKFLLSKGAKNKQIGSDPYWAEGKKGL